MSVEPIVVLSALEHHLYCARQCALIHVDGLWSENRATIAGSRAHRRVDTPGGRLERGRKVFRAVPLHSERYGLSGRADGVEVAADGTLTPVEHKSGVRHGRSAEVQLCAQALCLEEMFDHPVERGFVWYGGVRRRMAIEIDDELRAITLATIEEIRTNVIEGRLPAAVDDERCVGCQLQAACLPGVVVRPQQVLRYLENEVFVCR